MLFIVSKSKSSLIPSPFESVPPCTRSIIPSLGEVSSFSYVSSIPLELESTPPERSISAASIIPS